VRNGLADHWRKSYVVGRVSQRNAGGKNARERRISGPISIPRNVRDEPWLDVLSAGPFP
jgi:predicted nucleic acid-binding Zn ribbon protein